jgi:hypothetical protein
MTMPMTMKMRLQAVMACIASALHVKTAKNATVVVYGTDVSRPSIVILLLL